MHIIFQRYINLREAKAKSILKSLDYLRAFLGFSLDIDANKFMQKLMGAILEDEVSILWNLNWQVLMLFGAEDVISG